MGSTGVRVRALTVVQSETPRPSIPTHTQTITAEAAAAFDLEIEGLSNSEADQDLGAQLQQCSIARCQGCTTI